MGQVTISGTVYDVYGDETGLKTYMAGKLGSVNYDAATAADRKKALVSATRWIDREKWSGVLTDAITPQPLAFPRTGLTDCEENAVDENTVPPEVIDACYELVEILLGDATATSKSNQSSNVKKVGAGTAQVQFFRAGNPDGSGLTAGIFPTEAQKLLRCYLPGTTGIAGPLVSGTDQESSFCEDDFDLNEGMA
jgi:hypothetical protein